MSFYLKEAIFFIKAHWVAILGIAGFITTFFGVVYTIGIRKKDCLIKDIQSLISEAKSLPTWDERSEYKLSQWLDWNEGKLHAQTLVKLIKLRKSASKYLQIHYEMMNKAVEDGSAEWI